MKNIVFKKIVALSIVGSVFFIAHVALAQELMQDINFTTKARVLEILNVEAREVPGTDVKSNYQTLKVVVLGGEEKGQERVIENDYLNLKKGDVFYLTHTVNSVDGRDYYSVSEPYRLPTLYLFIGLFVLCVIVFGGVQGVRGLFSLAGSLLFIYFLLFPSILNGYSPILVSVGVASLIIILGSYVTHGFNKTTSTAVFGMILTIAITGVLAYLAVHSARLSGFESEEAIYLNLDTRGAIDFVGLLLGGILIGLLGVLYDAAISQSIAVEELNRVGPHLSRGYIFKRALRMGREHIGALVNTLAIAYVGASLPLLLLFYTSKTDFSIMINREIFATEIIRTMIGSIGLVLAVPITTAIAVWFLVKREGNVDGKLLEVERQKVEHIGHSH